MTGGGSMSVRPADCEHTTLVALSRDYFECTDCGLWFKKLREAMQPEANDG